MPSNQNRIDRINEEVMRELSTRLRSVKDPRLSGVMISILRCQVTNDLRWCKVHLSILGEYDEKEIKKGLTSCSGYLRRELAHSLSLRYTPELIFVIDDSIAHGAHINDIIHKLDIKQDTEEQSSEDQAE